MFDVWKLKISETICSSCTGWFLWRITMNSQKLLWMTAGVFFQDRSILNCYIIQHNGLYRQFKSCFKLRYNMRRCCFCFLGILKFPYNSLRSRFTCTFTVFAFLSWKLHYSLWLSTVRMWLKQTCWLYSPYLLNFK